MTLEQKAVLRHFDMIVKALAKRYQVPPEAESIDQMFCTASTNFQLELLRDSINHLANKVEGVEHGIGLNSAKDALASIESHLATLAENSY